jgi:hypothetical protein
MRYTIDYPGRITDENREAVLEKLGAFTKEELTAAKQPITIEHDGKLYEGLVYDGMKVRTFKINNVQNKPETPAAKVATAKKAAPDKTAAPKESAAKRKGK